MSTRNRNPERTRTNRLDEWKDGELTGPTGIPPEGQRHEDYFPPKWYQKRGAKVAGAALALVGAGTAIFGVTQGGGEANPTPERSPAASATQNPGETDVQEKPAEFGISAEEFQNNPELLGQEYYSQFNQFMIAGATQEASKADRRYEVGLEAYLQELSVPIDEQFIEELFVDGWEANPSLSEYVTTTMANANRTRELRLLSYVGVETSDLEPYVRETVIESMETTGDPTITTSTRWTERDNGAQTNIQENMDGPDVNDFAGGETFVWVNVDGKMKISDISHYDG